MMNPPGWTEKQKYLASFDCGDDVNKYERLAKIGQGTYGEVFKAQHATTGLLVALKKVIVSNEEEGFPITSLREIKLLQLLKHENIVSLLEICRTRPNRGNRWTSRFYLVFEFCDHDLAGLLSNTTIRFSLGEKKQIIKQLLNGLYYIHAKKVLHRDMKTANILITKKGILKLADFGLARAVSAEQNRYTSRVVTLWYRPPELLLGQRDYTAAIDMWGAGCIMAELWTRQPIMQGSTEQQQLTLISQLCGSITEQVWPRVIDCGLFHQLDLPQTKIRKVRDLLKLYISDQNAHDLLDQLLILDPTKRLDADGGLNHDFLWQDPMPCDLGALMNRISESMFEYLTPQRSGLNTKKANSSTSSTAVTDPNQSFSDRVF